MATVTYNMKRMREGYLNSLWYGPFTLCDAGLQELFVIPDRISNINIVVSDTPLPNAYSGVLERFLWCGYQSSQFIWDKGKLKPTSASRLQTVHVDHSVRKKVAADLGLEIESRTTLYVAVTTNGNYCKKRMETTMIKTYTLVRSRTNPVRFNIFYRKRFISTACAGGLKRAFPDSAKKRTFKVVVSNKRRKNSIRVFKDASVIYVDSADGQTRYYFRIPNGLYNEFVKLLAKFPDDSLYLTAKL